MSHTTPIIIWGFCVDYFLKLFVWFVSVARRSFKYHNIHEAVCHGEVEELEAMVKDGASINEIDSSKDRFTPTHWACHKGALEVRTVTSPLTEPVIKVPWIKQPLDVPAIDIFRRYDKSLKMHP